MSTRRYQETGVNGRGARIRAILGTAVAAGLLLPTAAAAAPDPEPAALRADGELVLVMVEPSGPGEQAAMDTLVMVGDALLDVPDAIAVPAGPTGTPVAVELTAPEGTSAEEAVAALAGEPDDPQVAITAVSATAAAATVDGAPTAEVVGGHSLTVLPVHFGAPDGTTVTQLGALAVATSDYWSAQSGGLLSMTTAVRDWQQIPDPGGCNPTTIWNEALKVHGISPTSVTATAHVALYFPRYTACAWAGLGSVGGGRVWVNGSPLEDVFAHEVGHNLGLGHAGTAECSSAGVQVALAPLTQCVTSAYGDLADVMGLALRMPSGNLNTAFADHLGLAQVRRLSRGETATVDLSPLAATSSLRSVAIPVAEGTVYLDFRPALGRDQRRPNWAGVQVHLRTMDASGMPTTYLLDMAPELPSPFQAPALATGRTWAVPGTTQRIEVVSVGTTAQVRVSTGLHKLISRMPGPTAGTYPEAVTGEDPVTAGPVAGDVTGPVPAAAVSAPAASAPEPIVQAPVTRAPVRTADAGISRPAGDTRRDDDALDALRPFVRQAVAAALFRYPGEIG